MVVVEAAVVGQGSPPTNPQELTKQEEKVLAAYVLSAMARTLPQEAINLLRAYHLQEGIEAVTDWYIRTHSTQRILETAGRVFICDTVREWADVINQVPQQGYAEASGVQARTLHYWREDDARQGTDGMKQHLNRAKGQAHIKLKDEFRRRGLIE